MFNNQRVIEAEARELQAQAAQFAKQTSRWVALVNDFDRALKEVGDFENWVKVMEWDMKAVSTALETASGAAEGGGARQALQAGAPQQQPPGRG